MEFASGTVERIRRGRDGFVLQAAGRMLHARTVVWASGVQDLWPEFPGVRRLVGRRLFWCIVCDGWRTWRRPLLVLGNDDAAARTTLQFLTYTRDVTLLVDPSKTRLSRLSRQRLAEQGVAVRPGRIRSARVREGECLEVRLEDGEQLRPAFVFSLLGALPRTRQVRALGLQLSRKGHIRVDDKNRTRLPAFFAAGDVTDRHSHQVVSAAHEGAMAAQAANQVLYPPAQKLPK